MNVLIIEDESRAAKRLEKIIKKLAPHMKIVAKLESVRDAVAFLQTNMDLQLIFSDIQLADGLSFEIYEQIHPDCPIIFTTAYDQYAIEAFKTNGIDYLLKPIEEGRLLQAIEKVEKLKGPSIDIDTILALTQKKSAANFKSRFMIRVGDKIKSISISEIQAFYSLEKATYILTETNRNYVVDYSLDQLEEMIDPKLFFKVNRKFIININACNEIIAWTNSRLKINIEGLKDQEIIVARDRVQDFKYWLDE